MARNPTQKREPTTVTQRQKFIEAARELECADDEEAFKRTLKQVAKAPAPKEPKPR